MKFLARVLFFVFAYLTVCAISSPVTSWFWWLAGVILAGLLWLAVWMGGDRVED